MGVFMKIERRITNIVIYSFVILFAVAESYSLLFAIGTGKTKTTIIVLLVPILVLMVGIFQRLRLQTTIVFLLLAFWIPAGISSLELFLFEVCIYIISFLLIIRLHRLDDEECLDDKSKKSFLINFPWFPFILYILGALLTWSLSTKTGGELDMIRVQCVFPLALSLVIYISVRSKEDAERLMWVMLTSAAVLGLVFLVGRFILPGYITYSSYASGSGRLSMSLTIPHRLGGMIMLPQRTSNVYGYLLVFAYSIGIFHHSMMHRRYAIFLCLIFGCIIITTQGRGGAITAALGAVIVSVYATFTGKLFGIKGVWIKLAIVGVAVIGGIWYLSTHSSNALFYQHGVSLFVNPQQDENLMGRFQRWSDGINLFLANPIFGTGLRGYETPWGLDTSEILNIFLYTLLSFGILGFIGFLLILFRFVVEFWKGIQSGDRTTMMMCIASLSGLLGFFFGLQSLEPYSMVIIWTPLVLAFAVSNLNRNRPAMDPGLVNVMK
jgi:O-antigen ligase